MAQFSGGRSIITLKSKGEQVDDVRTSSDEAWGVFLREFTHWCASDDARALLVKTSQRTSVSDL